MASLRSSARAVAAIFSLALAGGIAGCSGSAGPSETDARSFPSTAGTLTIDASEAALRIENGAIFDAIAVDRTLHGKAADDGNAYWSLEGGTLRLGIECGDLVIGCSGKYTVRVPADAAVELKTSGSPVRVESLAGDLDVKTTRDGSLRVIDPSGNLWLADGGGNIVVTGARSSDVAVTTSADGNTEGNIRPSFAGAPKHVAPRSSGSVEVTLPEGRETYRITGAKVSGNLVSDPTSERTVTVADATAAPA